MSANNLAAIAKSIYELVYDVDNKSHRARKVQEIYEWLAEGDPSALAMPLAWLVAEWVEYDYAELREAGSE